MHSPSDIQSHLYSSFLSASAYDVALRINGAWSAIYKLHRVVLIQSGFFKSLFTGGFSESASHSTTLRNGTDEITVTFDDMNITRPAFEICISRLYGGGPDLYISPNLIPTTAYPLTPGFSGVVLSDETPSGMHPATPSFLRSLLATAIYLSIPSVASQALSLILKTIGPTTVLQYLDFACGKVLDNSNEASEQPQAAVGLENVACLLDPDDQYNDRRSIFKTVDLSGNSSLISSEGSVREPHINVVGHAELPTHHYGAISNKIGEACSCWLTRWATDILQLEVNGASRSYPETKIRSEATLDKSKRVPISSISKAGDKLCIFGRRGLTAKWISAIVTADTLFIKNEKERYNFARSIVELRRQDGVLEEEERSWSNMFETGIYYEHMTFEDLHAVSQDVSPVTGRPYTTLSTLQGSHWAQSVMRHIVMNRNNTYHSATTMASPREKELGLAIATTEILNKATTSSDNTSDSTPNQQKRYFLVPSDASLRIGDTGSSTSASMDELFSPSDETAISQGYSSTSGSVSMARTEDTFFGIRTQLFSSGDCIDFDPIGNRRWSPYPPYRFSAEFWDIDLLKEKSRLHSQTIWYAGNLFNVYVQIARKKGQAQLGVYLQRQSQVDIPACSAPVTAVRNHKDGSIGGSSEHRASHLRQASVPESLNSNSSSLPSIHPTLSRSTTPSSHTQGPSSPPSPSSSPPGTYISFGTLPATLPSPSPQAPYRDPRSTISAYFSVSCASAIGSSQTRFSSSPDTFAVSQSWGWKSSTLRTEDFVELGTQTLPQDIVRNEQVSLRATVLLGLV